MRSHRAASADDIDIMSLMAALKRSLPRLLIVTIGAGALSFGVLSTMAPRYSSVAQLAIVAKSTNPFPDGRDRNTPSDSVTSRMDKEAINTQVRALQSTDLLLKVANGLKLSQLPEFNPRAGDLDTFAKISRLIGLAGLRPGETVDDTVLATLAKQLEISSPKESRSINVRFSSSDSELAAIFANRLAEDYRSSLVTDTVKETSDVVAALEPKVEQLRRELIEAEAEVERTRVQIDRTIGGQQKTPLIDQRLGELTAELSRADALRSDAESKWRGAKELMQTGSGSALPEAQKSPLIQNLEQQRVRLERSISELSASLLPGHPRMQQLNADLGGLKRQITGELQKLAQSLEKEARVGVLRVESIAKQITELKGRVINTSGDDAKLRAIDASAKSKRAELERLQKQLEDNKTVVVTKTVPIEARIVEQARASSVPTFPKKMPITLLVMTGTMLLGLAWIVTRELLVGARSGAGNVGGSAPKRPMPPSGGGTGGPPRGGLEPMLGRVAPIGPAAARATTGAATAVDPTLVTAPDAAPELTIETIAERVIARSAGQAGFRTMIAPESRSLDCTQEAIALARALSDADRQVLLVDWSFEGTGFSAELGVASVPGMNDLLTGAASFEDVITRVPGNDAHYLACGAELTDASVCADADRLNLVLDALDEAYEHIVVSANHDGARQLFQTIQGRFDAGVIVGDSKKRQSLIEDEPGSFLGFEVTDLDVMRCERSAAKLSDAWRSSSRGISAGPRSATREARP